MCLCEVGGNPHRVGHCQGETRGSEWEQKSYLKQPFSFSFERGTLPGKLEPPLNQLGSQARKKDTRPLQY